MCHGTLLAEAGCFLALQPPHAAFHGPVEGLQAASQEAGDEDAPSGPSAWCCTLDADMPLLLTVEEEEQYLERSLKAAANSCADLVPCPQPNCEGMAVAGKGEALLNRTSAKVLSCVPCLQLVVRSRQDMFRLLLDQAVCMGPAARVFLRS